MASKCCRSCPRCDDCPVLVMKRRRTDDLVTSVLLGAPPRELPAGVVAQLDALTAARGRRFERFEPSTDLSALNS